MRLVVEVRERLLSEADKLRIARAIAEQGSFSHPAYAELQGRDARMNVEILGALVERDEEVYDGVLGGRTDFRDVLIPLERL